MKNKKTLYFFLFGTIPAVLLLSLPSLARDTLIKTPADYEGPFYPVIRQQDEDNDLIQVAGRNQKARGEILYLSGRVVDENEKPFDKAIVEIWQTDTHGRYKDQRDRSKGQRDPDFQYWGKAVTSADGTFSFTTLVPGAYNPRPAHIHFKVWVAGQQRLTSQIYFRKSRMGLAEEGTTPDTHKLQTVDLHGEKDGSYTAFFQIVL